MVLNYIWIGFILTAFVTALIRLLFMGDVEVFPALMRSTFESAKTAFDISIGLTGVLTLWLGIMRIGEKGGVVDRMARMLSPVFTRLFPDIPKGHPAMGSIFMNLAANMLGLDNAATPLGLKAMQEMHKLNGGSDRASNAMIMFLVLNTSGLTLIPVSIMTYRAQLGAANPTDIFIPILLTTFVATLAGMIITAIYQRIRFFQPVLLLFVGGLSLLVALLMVAAAYADRAVVDLWSTTAANVLLMALIVTFVLCGLLRKVNVYEAFIEGAKDGFGTAVRIIPYLVAILVAIGLFRASGTMDWVTGGISHLVDCLGCDNGFVAALPTALMKPLSGAGARGMMVDAMQTYGADSFVGRLSCIFQGATDTTFYIIAVYFGSIGVRHTRHAVTCGLLADLAGVIAGVFVAYLFFATGN